VRCRRPSARPFQVAEVDQDRCQLERVPPAIASQPSVEGEPFREGLARLGHPVLFLVQRTDVVERTGHEGQIGFGLLGGQLATHRQRLGEGLAGVGDPAQFEFRMTEVGQGLGHVGQEAIAILRRQCPIERQRLGEAPTSRE
jgi:hypothetical protein